MRPREDVDIVYISSENGRVKYGHSESAKQFESDSLIIGTSEQKQQHARAKTAINAQELPTSKNSNIHASKK